MYRIGLTGGIATGKSTVAAMLRELGAKVIDADKIAREIVQPGQAAYHDIVEYFGPDVLLVDGQLNRRRLAEVIFNNPEARQFLNQATHPRVIARIEELVDAAITSGYRLPIVLDVPLLIEAGMASSVDAIWLVITDAETQLQRLMARNQLTYAEACARIKAQMPLAEKKQWADVIIDNSGSIAATRQHVEKHWNQLLIDLGLR
ncbi:MAG: dephospho-CoA kinase [Firmicutes bacterium]|nr:dephospho-CoA kinase [Bacillota bacterium]